MVTDDLVNQALNQANSMQSGNALIEVGQTWLNGLIGLWNVSPVLLGLIVLLTILIKHFLFKNAGIVGWIVSFVAVLIVFPYIAGIIVPPTMAFIGGINYG